MGSPLLVSRRIKFFVSVKRLKINVNIHIFVTYYSVVKIGVLCKKPLINSSPLLILKRLADWHNFGWLIYNCYSLFTLTTLSHILRLLLVPKMLFLHSCHQEASFNEPQ